MNRGEEEKGSKGLRTQLSTDKYTGSEMWFKPVYQGCKQAKVLSGDGDGYTLYAADRFQSHQPLKRKGATSLNLEGGQGGRLACSVSQCQILPATDRGRNEASLAPNYSRMQ